MRVQLDLPMRPQPNDETCGPTCLHARSRFSRDRVPLATVIHEVPRWPGGGTPGALLPGIVTCDANPLVLRPQ